MPDAAGCIGGACLSWSMSAGQPMEGQHKLTSRATPAFNAFAVRGQKSLAQGSMIGSLFPDLVNLEKDIRATKIAVRSIMKAWKVTGRRADYYAGPHAIFKLVHQKQFI